MGRRLSRIRERLLGCYHENCPLEARKPCWLFPNDGIMRTHGLEIAGYLLSEIGLGQSARLLVQAADEADIPLSLSNHTLSGRQNELALKERLIDRIPRRVSLNVMGLASLPRFARRICRQPVRLAYPFWELSTVPSDWKKRFDAFDGYWAASGFIRDMLKAEQNRPVELIPQPVLLPAVIPPPRAGAANLRCFTFFDFDSYVSRKNPFASIAAFQKAFPLGSEDATLVIKTRGRVELESFDRLQNIAKVDPRIIVINKLLSRDDLTLVMADSDVFLSLHRSEGFGFGCAEALAAGKAVVATNYSGTTDFITEATGYPVSFKMIPLKWNDYLGAEGAHWADPDTDHAAQLLREIYDDPVTGRMKAEAGFHLLREHHSPAVIGKRMRAALETMGE